MLGLPYSATPGDIINFFDGLNIVPDGIHFILNSNQRPSGRGFVEFSSLEDASRAMDRNKMMIGNRYIELFRCAKAEMIAELQGSSGLSMGGGMGNMPMGGMGMGMGGGMGNMGMAAAINALMGNMSAMGAMGGMGGLNNGMGSGYGAPQPQIADIYALLQSMGMIQYNAWQQQQQQQGPPQGYNNHYHQQSGRGYGGNHTHHGGMGDNGGDATVRLRGLPYQATAGDVLAFFTGYDVIRQSVTLGGGHDGRPSGEAWVQFSSPDEASRAVRERNRAHIGSRYVELFLV